MKWLESWMGCLLMDILMHKENVVHARIQHGVITAHGIKQLFLLIGRKIEQGFLLGLDDPIDRLFSEFQPEVSG